MLNNLSKNLKRNIKYNQNIRFKLNIFQKFKLFSNKVSNDLSKDPPSTNIEDHMQHEHEIKINCNFILFRQ